MKGWRALSSWTAQCQQGSGSITADNQPMGEKSTYLSAFCCWMKAREPVGVGHLLSLGQLRNAGSLCYSSSPKVPSHLGFYFIPFTDFLKIAVVLFLEFFWPYQREVGRNKPLPTCLEPEVTIYYSNIYWQGFKKFLMYPILLLMNALSCLSHF